MEDRGLWLVTIFAQWHVEEDIILYRHDKLRTAALMTESFDDPQSNFSHFNSRLTKGLVALSPFHSPFPDSLD